MIVFVNILPDDLIIIQASIISDEGAADLMEELSPGEEFMGVSYETFLKHGNGSFEIPDDGTN